MDDITSLAGRAVGVALTGSFCTFSKVFQQLSRLAAAGADLYPILSNNAYTMDTRFFSAAEVRETLEDICGRPPMHTLQEVEPIGPRKLLDLIIVAPLTGSTLARLALGVSDTPVAMAVKSQLRNERPVLLAISTNDGLTTSAPNLAALLGKRSVFFVPFGQDDSARKPASLVAHMDLIPMAAAMALSGIQLQPILKEY